MKNLVRSSHFGTPSSCERPSSGTCTSSSCQKQLRRQVVFLLAWGGSNVMDVQDMIDFYRELLPGCTIFVSTSNQKQSH